MNDVAGKRRSPCRPAAAAIAGVLLASACATQPPADFTVEVPQGVNDARGRFREIFCAVLQEWGEALPHYRSCDDALSHVAAPPPPTGRPVDLAPSRWDWSQGEPPMNSPEYYLRYCKTFNRMGGTMRYLSSDNRDFLLALSAALV